MIGSVFRYKCACKCLFVSVCQATVHLASGGIGSSLPVTLKDRQIYLIDEWND